MLWGLRSAPLYPYARRTLRNPHHGTHPTARLSPSTLDLVAQPKQTAPAECLPYENSSLVVLQRTHLGGGGASYLRLCAAALWEEGHCVCIADNG